MSDPPLPIIITTAGLVIDGESYQRHAGHREIADRLLATYGLDARDVCEARITEAAVEIDVIDHGPPFQFRTLRYPAHQEDR